VLFVVVRSQFILLHLLSVTLVQICYDVVIGFDGCLLVEHRKVVVLDWCQGDVSPRIHVNETTCFKLWVHPFNHSVKELIGMVGA